MVLLLCCKVVAMCGEYPFFRIIDITTREGFVQ